jgi:hypothetical protein
VIGTDRDAARITLHTVEEGDEEVIARRIRELLI